MIQKSRLIADFSRASRYYAREAHLQKRVAERLCRNAATGLSGKVELLDMGAGTGFIAEQMRGKLPEASFLQCDIAPLMCRVARESTGFPVICADMEALPLADDHYDGVLSSLAFQWLDQPERAMAESFRVLKPGGRMYLSTFCAGTLDELRQASQKAVPWLRINHFPEAAEVIRWAERAAFAVMEAEEVRFTEDYPDVRELMRHLKVIGARSKTAVPRPLTRHALEQLEKAYRLLSFADHGIISSWNVLFLTAKKPVRP